MRFLFLIAILALSACASHNEAPSQKTELVVKSENFADLPGWQTDTVTNAVSALDRSCARIAKNESTKSFAAFSQAGTYQSWQRVCQLLQTINKNNNAAVRNYFEQNFKPYALQNGTDPNGLFTGYYEASLKGSRTPSARYHIPLYARPDDLVMVDLGQFRPELKGQRIAGRVTAGNLKPYEDRAAIVTGQWPHNDKVLVWVDDPVDAFFVQIQGSGVVQLEGGGIMRIGYDGQNGYPYYAIGKELVKRGSLKQQDVSMQSIERWLKAHPDQADNIMNTNRSYVFFKEGGDGAKGGEGVILTPERSLAIDHSLLPYGLPLWVDAESPDHQGPRLQRLVMAQDTGGAITGAVRGDMFWGYGEHAETMAGPMKSVGRYWALLPQ